MGGSFNPPTIAHEALMLAAMEQLEADKGIFVPTADKALRRKMRKAGFPEEVLSEKTRLAMLESICAADPRLEVEDVEYRHIKSWYTLETLRHIREKYPEGEISFLIGADKLDVFIRAYRLQEFLDSFRYAVVKRSGDDPEKLLRERPETRDRLDRFHILTAPEGIGSVSSTAVREMLRTGTGDMEAMLSPEVAAILWEEAPWL